MGKNEIGVFLPCTGVKDPKKALEIAKRLDLRVVQIQSLQLSEDFYSKEGAKRFVNLLERYGIKASAVCMVFKGERYDDLETVRRTVGYLPPETLPSRLKYSKRCVDFAANINAPIVTTHMGVLPKNPSSTGYQRLLNAVREVARYCRNVGVTLALETGQESSTELLNFINLVGEDVKVNFDGANFILYGIDNPIKALRTLKDHIVHVHVKDGLPPEKEDLLGREVSLGEGKAEVRKTICELVSFGYTGPFIMEIYVWRERKIDPLLELQKGKFFISAALDCCKIPP